MVAAVTPIQFHQQKQSGQVVRVTLHGRLAQRHGFLLAAQAVEQQGLPVERAELPALDHGLDGLEPLGVPALPIVQPRQRGMGEDVIKAARVRHLPVNPRLRHLAGLLPISELLQIFHVGCRQLPILRLRGDEALVFAAHVGWGDAVLVFQIGQDADAFLRRQLRLPQQFLHASPVAPDAGIPRLD